MSASEEVGSVCAAGRDPREVLRQLQLEDGSFDVDLLQLEPGEEYGYASDGESFSLADANRPVRSVSRGPPPMPHHRQRREGGREREDHHRSTHDAAHEGGNRPLHTSNTRKPNQRRHRILLPPPLRQRPPLPATASSGFEFRSDFTRRLTLGSDLPSDQ